MINYKEFIQKFSHLLGIPVSEGRLSLEVFAKFVSQRIELGDELKIEPIGYFAFKKIKSISDEGNEYQKAILFSEEKISRKNKDILLFLLPDESQQELSGIDTYFNLSLGKSVINPVKADDTILLFSSNKNEMISLIESKVEKIISDATIYKHSEVIEKEFFVPSKREVILFDTGKDDEPTADTVDKESEEDSESTIINEEKRIIKTFDDFELVEVDKIERIDLSSTDKKDEVKLVFDDLTGIEDVDLFGEKNVESAIDGYSEVKDPLLTSLLSNSNTKKDVLKNPFDESFASKSTKNFMKKLVPVFVGLLIILTVATSIYLNYDKIKSFFIVDESKSRIVELKKRKVPIIISNTFKFPVTYPYKKDVSNVKQTPDSMIISPLLLSMKQNSVRQSSSEQEILSDLTRGNKNQIVKIRENIYQRGFEFVVQVSSWKSKSKAENEVKKFKDNGFPTELVEYSSRELGKYHKVMVGGFNSIEEAKKFLNQNK
jgi:hypothetical protein